MRESFNQKLKDSLHEIPVRKKCCRFTADAAGVLYQNDISAAEKITELHTQCRCDGCLVCLVRELYLRYGTMTDPMKRYHLDLSFPSEEEREAAHAVLSSAGFEMFPSERKGKPILYYKKSDDIEDFLAYIGASAAAFDMMNARIVKDFRNSVNRQVNCDTANIGKQLEASQKYIEAIQALNETGNIHKLPETLKKTAQLRVENSQLSLAELGHICEPQVSKSGMKHRMEKIYEYYCSLCLTAVQTTKENEE